MATRREAVIADMYDCIPNYLQERRRASRRGETLCIHGQKTCDTSQMGHLLQVIDEYQLNDNLMLKISADSKLGNPRTRSVSEVLDELTQIPPLAHFYTEQPVSTTYPAPTKLSAQAPRVEYQGHSACSWLNAFEDFVYERYNNARGLSFSDFSSKAGKPAYDMPVRPVFELKCRGKCKGKGKK